MIKLITNNPLFYACRASLAAINCLKHRFVCLIVHVCEKIGLIHTVAHKRLFPVPPSPERRIDMGYGEFVVFYPDASKVAKSNFVAVWPLLAQRPTPADLREKVREIDPKLEVCFVPRTLYELIFVVKCVAEDRRQGALCPLLDFHLQETCSYKRIHGQEAPFPVSEEILAKIEAEKRKRHCWHLSYFQDKGDPILAEIVDVAWRLNKSIHKHFPLHKEGMTYSQIMSLTEAKITYLRAFYCQQQNPDTKIEAFEHCNYPGPTGCLGTESTRLNIRPMGIRNEEAATILRHAVAHESSVGKAFLLYRGSNFSKDRPDDCSSSSDRAYSISYGTGLFAGCLYDAGACAFAFARNSKDAYMLTIPEEEAIHAPFDVLSVPAVCQFYGHGELFHARSKVWKEGQFGGGFYSVANQQKLKALNSDIPKDRFTALFQKYMDRAVFLK